jgi:hypothetical protein
MSCTGRYIHPREDKWMKMGYQAVVKAILSMLLFFKVSDEFQCYEKKQPSYEAQNIRTSI